MSRRREVFVGLSGLCPKADPVVNLMSWDGKSSETKAGFTLDLGNLATIVGVLFLSLFFCYLFNLVMERA